MDRHTAVSSQGGSETSCAEEKGRVKCSCSGKSDEGKDDPEGKVCRGRDILQFGNEQQADGEVLSPFRQLQGSSGEDHRPYGTIRQSMLTHNKAGTYYS